MTKQAVLAWLGTRMTRDAMPRYGLVARRAYGVPMGTLLKLSQQIGTDHALANELWDRSPRLRRRAIDVAARLTRSEVPEAAWVGRDAKRDLGKATCTR